MKNILLALLVIVVLGGGYWMWQGSQEGTVVPAPTDTVSTGTQVPVETGPVNTGMTATVKYDGSKFSPAEVTIKVGGTVTFEAEDGSTMWVASASHPDHTAYSGTTRQQHCPDTSNDSFDQCAAGDSYIFAFKKVGTWPYHDHLNASAFGKVIVVE